VNAAESEFLKTVVPPAQAAQRAYGVPASITIAQAILESSNSHGWGQSTLATLCNNYFGIKAGAHAAPGEYREFPTTEFVQGSLVQTLAKFAKYSTPEASFLAHARLLALAPRYQPCMAVRKDPAEFAERLQSCGYSTNPNYAADLMRLVRDYDLTQYDLEPQPPAEAQTLAA
jgi:flagellum-specific peptidoglycan hydrolase FlgJ